MDKAQRPLVLDLSTRILAESSYAIKY